jgi:hypothetical protein
VSIGSGASIGDGASIEKGEWHFTAGPQGSRNALATAVLKPEGLRWWVGCQEGITTDVFRERVLLDHAEGSASREDYLHLIAMVETHPAIARATAAKSAEASNG